MTIRAALDEAMQSGTADEAMSALIERGVWMADVDTMTQAVHSVYCGIMADTTIPTTRIAIRLDS